MSATTCEFSSSSVRCMKSEPVPVCLRSFSLTVSMFMCRSRRISNIRACRLECVTWRSTCGASKQQGVRTERRARREAAKATPQHSECASQSGAAYRRLRARLAPRVPAHIVLELV
eukprot:scaffold82682_cov35-Tisochrysis_lutea.AAC.1